MYYFIECLRFLAVALITNSHFKGIYPIDFIATGGGYGVTIFFMISGFLLADIKKEISFKQWYCKKILRIYIPFIIFSFFEFILKIINLGFEEWTMMNIVNLLFPLKYWFAYVIAFLYIIYFLFVKHIRNKQKVLISIVTLIISFGIWYLFLDKSMEILLNANLIMWIIWFISMLIGFWIRNFECAERKHSRNLLWITVIFISILIFFVTKICIAKHIFMYLQIFLPVSYIGFAYSIFHLFRNAEKICQKIINTAFLGKLITMVSNASLEIYYVQFIWIKLLKNILFPLNWILIVFFLITSAYILHIISNKLVKLFLMKIDNIKI